MCILSLGVRFTSYRRVRICKSLPGVPQARLQTICWKLSRTRTASYYGAGRAPMLPSIVPDSEGLSLRRFSMPKPLTWDDAEDIGILLSETHPELDPLTVRFTDLHRYVTELPDFKGDPKTSNEGKLEAIQMAWHEEFQDRTQG